jgi:hypothetical protein
VYDIIYDLTFKVYRKRKNKKYGHIQKRLEEKYKQKYLDGLKKNNKVIFSDDSEDESNTDNSENKSSTNDDFEDFKKGIKIV